MFCLRACKLVAAGCCLLFSCHFTAPDNIQAMNLISPYPMSCSFKILFNSTKKVKKTKSFSTINLIFDGFGNTKFLSNLTIVNF